MLEVHCSTRFGGVLLCDNNHPGAPFSGGSNGDLAQDAHLDVVVQLLLDCLLPVKRYRERFVKSYCLCIFVSEQFHWERVLIVSVIVS